MIGRRKKPHTELPLGLHLLIDIVIDVEAGRILLTEVDVMNDDLVLLADTKDAPSRLVHQSRRPPRRREDHAAHVLQIQTSPTTLYLHQHHGMLNPRKLMNVLQEYLWHEVLVTRHGLVQNGLHSTHVIIVCLLHQRLRLGNHISPLAVREAPVVHQHLADARQLLEMLLKHIHLVLKVAEDDKALGPRLLMQNLGHVVDLGGCRCPVGPPIGDARKPTLLGGDIDLGMDTDLTEAQQHRQKHEATGIVLLHQVHHVGRDTALDPPVEGGLLLCTELNTVVLHDRRLGEDVGQIHTKLIHGAAEGICLHPALQSL